MARDQNPDPTREDLAAADLDHDTGHEADSGGDGGDGGGTIVVDTGPKVTRGSAPPPPEEEA